MKTEVWAHRGSSQKFIENTLAAFSQAIKDGVDGVELDVQRTIDGELVVFHDESLKRLTGTNTLLSEMTLEELQELILSSPIIKSKGIGKYYTQIPALVDVLRLFKNTDLTINIELKNNVNLYPGMELEVAELVKLEGMEDQVLYSSFNHASMALMSRIVGSKHCGLLSLDIHFQPWNYLRSVNVESYHPMINSLQQPGFIDDCSTHGLKTHVWTVNEDYYIYACLLLGVDAIMTDVPERAISLREQFIKDNGKKAREIVNSLDFLGLTV